VSTEAFTDVCVSANLSGILEPRLRRFHWLSLTVQRSTSTGPSARLLPDRSAVVPEAAGPGSAGAGVPAAPVGGRADCKFLISALTDALFSVRHTLGFG